MEVSELIPGLVATKLWPSNAKNMKFSAAGLTPRTVESKLTDIKSLVDYAGNMLNFETAVDGGIGVIPNINFGFGAYVITKPGEYTNGSPELLTTMLHSSSVADNANATRQLFLSEFAGSNIGKRRMGHMTRMKSAGPGGTIFVDGTGDFSRGNFAYKTDYSAAAGDGEIGGNYTVVRQGGASATLNDCSAELYNVATYSDSFACQTEGITTKFSAAHAVTHAIRVQTGYMKTGINDMGGLAISVDAGPASNLIATSVQAAASATSLIQHTDLNRAVGKQEIVLWSGAGRLTIKIGADLGGVLGNTIPFRTVQTFSSNQDGIEERMFRTANGADFTTAEYRFYRLIDATVGGGLSFGYEAARTHTAALTINGNAHIKVGANLSIGFNGATPITKPALGAAAVDLATSLALLNTIRQQLINYGLATA